eukprot:scaffold30.g4461.t1
MPAAKTAGTGTGAGMGLPPPAATAPGAAPVERKPSPSLDVATRPALVTGARLHWQQLAALTRKNLTLRRRAWKTNVALLAQARWGVHGTAVLFVLLIWGVDKAVVASRQRQPAYSSTPEAAPARRARRRGGLAIGPVPDCAANMFMRHGEQCYTLLYAPAVHGHPLVEAVVAGVADHNAPPIPRAHLRGFASGAEIDAWLLAHTETTLGAVIFNLEATNSSHTLSSSPRPPAAAAPAQLGAAAGPPPPGAAQAAALPGGARASQLGAGSLSSPWGVSSVGFSIQTNSSVQWFKGKYQDPTTYMQARTGAGVGAERRRACGWWGLPLQSAVQRELVRQLAGDPGLGWEVALATFPHPAAQSPSVVGLVAPTFLFASIMFQFVLLVHDLVHEKESGVRRAMETMGLRGLPFWTSHGALAVLGACLLVAFSYAFRFDLFLRNAFALSFLLLVLVALAMAAFGFAAGSAVPVAFFVFVVAWVFLIVIAFGFPYKPTYATAAIAAFSSFPWSLLSKGIRDLADAAKSPTGGLTWAGRFSYCQPGYWQGDCVLPLGQIYWVLAVQIAGYLVLALYLDSVLPDSNGVRRPPWFFLQPGYWWPSKRRNMAASAAALVAPTEEDEGLAVDPDVRQEQQLMRRRCRRYLQTHRAAPDVVAAALAAEAAEAAAAGGGGARHSQAGSASSRRMTADGAASDGDEGKGAGSLGGGGEAQEAEQAYALEMFGLRKVYPPRGGGGPAAAALARLLRRRRAPFVALRGNWLGVREGECFCLLGPNGAGKSTTVNCLTGVIPFSSGEALVYGESLASAGGMARARPVLGVCPQFDVLFEDLTGREHLLLFAAIKGEAGARPGASAPASPRAALLGQARCALWPRLAVRLTEAASVAAGAYSGGMRRRLSVAIALLGDPRLVFLDEPSTGLDPISRRGSAGAGRRHLWDLLDRAKRGRALVLTTHSMEEAEALADRRAAIGIMACGRLRCVGTSLRLKSRFGSGYRVSIRVAGEGAGTAAGSASTPADAVGSPEAKATGDRPPAPQPGAAAAPHGGTGGQRSPAAAAQAAAVKRLFQERLGVASVDESQDYVHFLVPYEQEARLPALFSHLKERADALGVADVQLRLAPLEEVFLTVSRRAELEAAQAEGRTETLALAEEAVAVRVPVGAELITSPGGQLYHDESGELRILDYWRDPVNDRLGGGSDASRDQSGSGDEASGGGDARPDSPVGSAAAVLEA